jgi:uncharacterized protein (TIGR02145 family)
MNANGVTRAAIDVLSSSQFGSGETFYAYFPTGVRVGASTSACGTSFTTLGTGSTTPATQPYFTDAATSAPVYAYYPYVTGKQVTEAITSFSVEQDQTSEAGYKKSDLMYATATATKNGNSGSGVLHFAHKMSKIIVNASSTSLQIQAIRIVGGSRTISIADATTTDESTSPFFGATPTYDDANTTLNYITMYTGSGVSANGAALIPPQTITGGFLQVVTDAGIISYSLSSKTFVSGGSYTYALTVTSASIGLTIDITDWDTSEDATDLVNNGSTSYQIVPKAVDLGLSVKWANMNVGASSPTDYGMYFMWGDVAGHPGANNNGTATDGFNFAWANYKWTTDGGSTFTKYTSSDGKTTLEAADDAATAYWGSGWRMPTQAEFNELLNNTTKAWTYDYNDTGVAGYTFTANGQTLFLPAAGYRNNTGVSSQGLRGLYWSSTLNSDFPNYAYYLYFDSDYADVYDNFRYFGYTVRPVYDPYTSMSRAMPSDVGKVICSNGHIHATVSAVDCGGTASGIIAYVGDAGTADYSSGSGSYKGLALALYDYGGSLTTNGTTCQWYTANSGTCITNGQSSTLSTAIGTTGDFGKGIDNTNRLATAACGSGHVHAAAQNAKNFSVARPSGASQWFLPTMYQWNLMVKAMCGKSTDLTTSTNNDYKADKFNEKITAAGGRGVLSYYWSSVEYDTDFAWRMGFGSGNASNGSESSNGRVRAVFAF